MPSLNDVFNFSHSSDFPLYQKWLEMDYRDRNDPSLKLSVAELKHLEAWPVVQSLFEQVLPEAVLVLASYEDAFKVEFQKYEKAVRDLENQNKLFEFYKSVLDRLTKNYLDSLSGMLTEVYQSVYSDLNKQIQLQMVDFRNKKVIRLNVINKVDGKDFIEDFDTQGGSTHVLLGMIVAIYFILVTGAPRIILIDESLGALHQDVFFKFMGILKQFVSRLDFVFVIIDHHAAWFQDYADKVYVIENSVYKSVNKDTFFSSMGR